MIAATVLSRVDRSALRPPNSDQFWGDRCGTLTDPHGFSWTIATHKEDLTREELERRQTDWMKQFAPQSMHA